jgi:hypothetical protein
MRGRKGRNAGKERESAMSDTTKRLDQTEEVILTYEVSDEALEIAAGAGEGTAGNFTLGACTGLAICPVG